MLGDDAPDSVAASPAALTSSPPRTGAPGSATGTNQRATLALISVAGLLVSLTQTILIPVLPTLTVSLHTSSTNVEWLLTSTLMAAAVAVPVAGRLADLYGKKKLLLLVLVKVPVPPTHVSFRALDGFDSIFGNRDLCRRIPEPRQGRI